jgi:hypothetical protein
MLPFPAADFKNVPVGHGWDDRFDAALANDRIEVLPPPLEKARGHRWENIDRSRR